MEETTGLSKSEKKREDWMNTKWRPMMGWMYMAVCIFDFILAPILWSLLQALSKGSIQMQWQPLTLQGAGLFHIAMGAVLGIAAYGRTQEKINGIQYGTTYVPPIQTGQTNVSFTTQPTSYSTYGYTQTARFTPTDQNFASEPQQYAQVTTGYAGKKAPWPADEPLI